MAAVDRDDEQVAAPRLVARVDHVVKKVLVLQGQRGEVAGVDTDHGEALLRRLDRLEPRSPGGVAGGAPEGLARREQQRLEPLRAVRPREAASVAGAGEAVATRCLDGGAARGQLRRRAKLVKDDRAVAFLRSDAAEAGGAQRVEKRLQVLPPQQHRSRRRPRCVLGHQPPLPPKLPKPSVIRRRSSSVQAPVMQRYVLPSSSVMLVNSECGSR